jgi:hypothetical protein
MTSTNQSIRNYKSYNRSRNSKNDWSRSSAGSSFSFRRNFESDQFSGKGNDTKDFKNNFESDKFSGRRDGSKPTYTLLEDNPFSDRRSKTFKYTRLLGAKKIRNKSRNGHEEGLFGNKVSHYQDKKTYHLKHRRGKSSDRVGVKKMH